jgi:hypothetical protein
MNAFHPALTGILYDALARHEQALIQMALAANIAQADVDDEIAERYGAIVDGLKRMITIAEPSSPAARPGIEAVEGMRRAYLLLGHLQAELSEFDIWSWTCHTNEIDANLRNGGSGNEAARAAMRTVADRIGVDYIEKFHGSSDSTLIICAKGTIDGVRVRIYDLIDAERPICDTHHVMVDADGVCTRCTAEAPTDRHAMLQDGTETARCGAIGGAVALFADDVTCLGCLALLAQQAQETAADAGEYDPDDPDHLADSDGTGRYTEDQLAGYACAGCGKGFGAEPQVRVGHTLPGGGVVTDIGLSAHPDCIDSTIPELGDAP